MFVFLLYSTSKADLVFSYLGEGGDSWRGRGTSPPFLPTRLTELLQGQSSVSNTVTLQWESLIHSDSVPTLSILVSSRNYTPTEGSAGIFIIYKWQECNLLGTVWCVSWCPWYLARHRTLEKELKRASLNSGISGGVVPCLQVHQAVLVPGFLQHNTPERCSATRTPHPAPESHCWLAALRFDENRELQSHGSLQAVRKHQGSSWESSPSVCQQNCYCLSTSIFFLKKISLMNPTCSVPLSNLQPEPLDEGSSECNILWPHPLDACLCCFLPYS